MFEKYAVHATTAEKRGDELAEILNEHGRDGENVKWKRERDGKRESKNGKRKRMKTRTRTRARP